MNNVSPLSSPGLVHLQKVIHPQPIWAAPASQSSSSQSSGTLSILTLYAETLAEEQAAREILSARVNVLENDNAQLRTTLATLSARFEAHILRCEDDARSPASPPSVSRTKPRPASTPVRTL